MLSVSQLYKYAYFTAGLMVHTWYTIMCCYGDVLFVMVMCMSDVIMVCLIRAVHRHVW